MHPSFPNLPSQLSEYLLSKFPRDQLIAKKAAWQYFLAKIEEFLINLSLKSDDIQPLHQTE